jgi:chromosome segregation ATPase
MASAEAMEIVDEAVGASREARIVNPGMGAAWKPFEKQLRNARAALHEARKHKRDSVPMLEQRVKAAQKAAIDARDAFLLKMGRNVESIKTDVAEIKTDVADIKKEVGKVKTVVERLEEKIDTRDTKTETQLAQILEKLGKEGPDIAAETKDDRQKLLEMRAARQRTDAAMNEVRARNVVRIRAEKQAAREAKAREKEAKNAEKAEKKAEREKREVAKKKREEERAEAQKRKAEALEALEAKRHKGDELVEGVMPQEVVEKNLDAIKKRLDKGNEDVKRAILTERFKQFGEDDEIVKYAASKKANSLVYKLYKELVESAEDAESEQTEPIVESEGTEVALGV